MACADRLPRRVGSSGRPPTAATLSRPPGSDLALLAVAVSISSSGPIIAATVAPALAIAFWRCFLGSAATAPWVRAGIGAEVRR